MKFYNLLFIKRFKKQIFVKCHQINSHLTYKTSKLKSKLSTLPIKQQIPTINNRAKITQKSTPGILRIKKSLKSNKKPWKIIKQRFKSKLKKPKRNKILVASKKDFFQVEALKLTSPKSRKFLNLKLPIKIHFKSKKFKKLWKWTNTLMRQGNNGWTTILWIKSKQTQK